MVTRLVARRVIAGAAFAVLYVIAVSGEAYRATTPTDLPHHILLRKVYALVAFTLLGALLERASVPKLRGMTAAGIVVAVYSYAIELGQIFIKHVNETFAEHGFDVASGLVGGALGAFIVLATVDARAPRRRWEAIALAVLLTVIAWWYTRTYGLLDL
jgi:hypothetical protein